MSVLVHSTGSSNYGHRAVQASISGEESLQTSETYTTEPIVAQNFGEEEPYNQFSTQEGLQEARDLRGSLTIILYNYIDLAICPVRCAKDTNQVNRRA